MAEATVRPRALLSAVIPWTVMAVLAVLNGGFREAVLRSRLGHDGAHVLSTALLTTAILIVTDLYVRVTSIEYTQRELLAVGTGWTALTVGFEFLVGYVEGTPVSVTIGQYNVLAGKVWIAVPITLFAAPTILWNRRK